MRRTHVSMSRHSNSGTTSLLETTSDRLSVYLDHGRTLSSERDLVLHPRRWHAHGISGSGGLGGRYGRGCWLSGNGCQRLRYSLERLTLGVNAEGNLDH